MDDLKVHDYVWLFIGDRGYVRDRVLHRSEDLVSLGRGTFQVSTGRYIVDNSMLMIGRIDDPPFVL